MNEQQILESVETVIGKEENLTTKGKECKKNIVTYIGGEKQRQAQAVDKAKFEQAKTDADNLKQMENQIKAHAVAETIKQIMVEKDYAPIVAQAVKDALNELKEESIIPSG